MKTRVVKLWVLRGIKKGILTTKYPREPPTQDELVPKSIPPCPTEKSDWKEGERICPTGAIESSRENNGGRIDLAKCIYCQRCAKAGFEFSDSSSTLQASFVPNERGFTERDLFNRYGEKWKTFKKSFHILLIDVGSCNACNLEVLNLINPYYDLQRLGIFFTNSPKHADALVVVGALNKTMVDVLRRTYDSMPNPKLVIAAGACALSGGIFQTTESFVSPVQSIIPVDVIIPGCPPNPIQILQGLLTAMGKIGPGGTERKKVV